MKVLKLILIPLLVYMNYCIADEATYNWKNSEKDDTFPDQNAHGGRPPDAGISEDKSTPPPDDNEVVTIPPGTTVTLKPSGIRYKRITTPAPDLSDSSLSMSTDASNQPEETREPPPVDATLVENGSNPPPDAPEPPPVNGAGTENQNNLPPGAPESPPVGAVLTTSESNPLSETPEATSVPPESEISLREQKNQESNALPAPVSTNSVAENNETANARSNSVPDNPESSLLDATTPENKTSPPPDGTSEEGSEEANTVPRYKSGYGSHSVRSGEHPYHLQIIYDGHLGYCGATLIISPSTEIQIGITAAGCMYGKPTYKFMVQAGSNLLNDPHAQLLRVKDVVIHDQYNIHLPGNDIAVIFFDGQFVLHSYIQPLALPEQNQSFTGNVTVTGWRTGTPRDPYGRPNALQAVSVSLLPNRKCDKVYKKDSKFHNITDKDMCIKDLKNAWGSCIGDAGAAAMWSDENGKEFIAGVVSFQDTGCNSAYLPVVYPNVSYYVDWIKKISRRAIVGYYENYDDYYDMPSRHYYTYY